MIRLLILLLIKSNHVLSDCSMRAGTSVTGTQNESGQARNYDGNSGTQITQVTGTPIESGQARNYDVNSATQITQIESGQARNYDGNSGTQIDSVRARNYDGNSATQIDSVRARTFTSTATFKVNTEDTKINILEQHNVELREQVDQLKREIHQLENMLENQKLSKVNSACACDCNFRISDDNSSNRTTDLLQQLETSVLEKLSTITESLSERAPPFKRHKRTSGTYVGCFQDSDQHRGLKGFATINSLNSIESCVFHCRSGNYVYAGLQAGSWCLCDNSRQQLARNQKLDDVNCNMACPGNATQRCGAGWMNSIYETGIEQYLLDEEGQQLTDSYLTPHPKNYFQLIG